MRMPTLTPGNEHKEDSLNPANDDYERRFNETPSQDEVERGIRDLENMANDPKEHEKPINSQESEPGSTWNTNVGNKDSKKKTGVISKLKKYGPFAGIGGVLGVGGFAIIGLMSPSILLIQMNEVLTSKFNTQLASMETRSNKLITAKLNNTTGGLCAGKISIKCKFSSMSDKQVAKLKAAGVEVIDDGKTTITGRTKPTGLRYNGVDISAREFSSTLSKDAGFRSAMRQAYSPKYAGFVGKAWAKVASKFKISKQAPELGAEEDRAKARAKVNDIAKEGMSGGSDTSKIVVGEKKDPSCEKECATWSEKDAEDAKTKAGTIKDVGADDSAAKAVRNQLSTGAMGSISSVVKITGALDSACQAYGAVTALSYGAKVIRAAQLVRYFMIYSSMADAIKAGVSPNPKDVEILGTALTSTVKDTSDSTKTIIQSGPDAFGYKYAAYGDTSAPKKNMNIANRFIAGGGFGGEMSGAVAGIMSLLPGGRQGAKNTCGVLANPIVQGASLLVGVAALFIPGANIGKTIVQGSISAAIGVAIAVAPALLADMVAGTVTKDIVGEESVNAMTSGAGALMSDSLAAQNGNGPMTIDDAVAYNNIQNETSSQYIADELRSTSPFDTSNPHTFLGSIALNLNSLRSSSNPVTMLGSVLSLSLKGIIPTSSAVSTEQYKKGLQVCEDPDIVDANYAADPFCNVVRGIPPKYLNKDPLAVIDELQSAGELSEEGQPQGEYQTFITDCIQNNEPLGYADATTGYDNAAAQKCIVNDSNANYYLNFMDQRIELGQSDEDTETTQSSGSGDPAGATFNEADLFKDSTQTACAVGTTEAGQDTGYHGGPENSFPVRLCAIPGTNEGGKPIRVSSIVSGAVLAMINAMRNDLGDSVINASDSFRTKEGQEHAYRCWTGNRLPGEDCSDIAGKAAAPGTSMHQSGNAIDFQLPTGNRGSSRPGDRYWDWLTANAGKYGYKQYSGESWHWSATGG